MSTHSSALLAREIFDEFLVCKICFSAYKNPKCLECLHTFCEKCIEAQFQSKSSYKQFTAYRDIVCPVCQKRTSLPTGGAHMLPDNFTVSSLLEIIGPQCPDVSRYPSCDVCKRVMRKHREATAKCLDCVKLLCAECLRIHSETKVTSGHSLFGIQVEKDVQCNDHPEEAVRFFCIPCDACVCVLCTFKQHQDHEVIQFTEAVSSCRDHIGALLAACKDKSSCFDRWVDAVSNCEDIITMTTQKIKDTSAEYVEAIQNAEERLLEELHQMVGSEVMGQLERKKELIAVVESMRATCDLSDIIIGGKDMELLLLKKDVEEKLESMKSVQVDELPEEYASRIEYVSGTVNLGNLWDGDKPVMMTTRKEYVPDPTDRPKRSRETGSQTGPDVQERSGTESKKVHTGTMTDAGDSGRKYLDTGPATPSPLSPLSQAGSVDNKTEQNGQEPVRRRRRDPAPTASGNGVN